MSNSPLLALPYLAASQAQKHVTLNEALSILDGLLHLAVITRSLATPPTTPADGDRYLIAASPTAAVAGCSGTAPSTIWPLASRPARSDFPILHREPRDPVKALEIGKQGRWPECWL